jgi:hypothetical protein
LLTQTFDFTHYAFIEPRIIVNQLRNVHFCHQFKIEFAIEGDKVPTMWRKQISTHADWAPEGVKFLKEKIEERDIWATDVLPFCKKGERVQPYLKKIQNALDDLQKRFLNKACRTLLSSYKVSWWEAFFEEQKCWNASYLV